MSISATLTTDIYVPAKPRLGPVSFSSPLVSLLAIFIFCSFLFVYGIDRNELYRTESLRAIIAADFLRTGNWIVPTLYGEPLLTKPPGMYAAIALLSGPIGHVTEWSARLPSALSASVSVLLFFWFFSREWGTKAGLLMALLLPTSFMWLDKSMAAEIDMMQVAWVSAAMLFFLRALEIEEAASDAGEAAQVSLAMQRERSGRWWLASLLCVAGGVLTKWTAPAFFYGTIIPLLWWRGRLRLLLCRGHLTSAAIGAALCFAWAGSAIALVGWDTFFDTVSREALMRLSPGHHHRAYPWVETLTHPARIFLATLPGSGLALLTLWPGFAGLWDERGKRLLQALHCWVWPNVLFWSLVPEHSVRHSFPLFPGMMGLAGMVWIAWFRGALPWRLFFTTPARLLTLLLVSWVIAKFVFVLVVIPGRAKDRDPRAKGEHLAALVPIGHPLYLFRLKDEGIMFYYGRPVCRLADPRILPVNREPRYCILDESEWKQWDTKRSATQLSRLRDEQGAPIVLIRVEGQPVDAGFAPPRATTQ